MGHYVCWNCSKDIREGGLSESQIVDEYRSMRLRDEYALERRNRTFFVGLVGVLFVLAGVNMLLGWRVGTSVLFVLLALLPAWWALKSNRRVKRIRQAQKEHQEDQEHKRQQEQSGQAQSGSMHDWS